MLLTALSITPVASAMRRSARRRSRPALGRRARAGPTVSSSQSRIAAESISTSPSSNTSEGMRASGLVWRIYGTLLEALHEGMILLDAPECEVLHSTSPREFDRSDYRIM